MSLRVLSEVWRNAQVGGSALLVLLALADHANDERLAWPALATLAHKCRLSVRQTRRVLRDLEAQGYLESRAEQGRSNLYYLVPLADVCRGELHSPSPATPPSPAPPPPAPTTPSATPVIPSAAPVVPSAAPVIPSAAKNLAPASGDSSATPRPQPDSAPAAPGRTSPPPARTSSAGGADMAVSGRADTAVSGRADMAASAKSPRTLPEPDLDQSETPISGPNQEERWEQALKLLRDELGEEAARVWLGGSYPLTCDQTTLVVALLSVYACDWVQNRLYASVVRAVEAAWGRRLVVRFSPARRR